MSGSTVVRQRKVIPEDIAEDFFKILFGVPLAEKKNDDFPRRDAAEEKRPEPEWKR